MGSHDCHVFMQRLLPVGIRHLLPEDVVKPIMLLSRFFSQLTAKTLRRTDMFQLRHDIVQVLCKFEMIFPPAFFTSMIRDGSLARRGIACWSCQLSLDVSNRKASRRAEKKCTQQAKPEGSIIEAWVQYESFLWNVFKRCGDGFQSSSSNND
ncbi:transposable element gene, partial [Prunus dulcis]